MRFTIEIRRRHLVALPLLAATVVLALTVGMLTGLGVAAFVFGTYIAVAVLLATVDTIITSTVPWIRRRRRDREIERSITVHPSSQRRPKHLGAKGAAAA